MNVDQLVAEVVSQQDGARQLRAYHVIGRLYSIESDHGRIQFDRHTGPGVAQQLDANGDLTGQLLFVSPWEKLPAVQEYSEEFCTACLAPCDVCEGKSKALCIYVGCGGRGRVPDGEDPCPGDQCVAQTTKFNPQCTLCGGYGAIARFANCPCCQGSGKADCGACRGSGKRPTGKTKDGKAKCTSCHGSLRSGKFKQQDLGKMIAGQMSRFLVVGPVMKMILSPVQSAETVDRVAPRWNIGGTAEVKGGSAFLRLSPQRDNTGQPMLILLPMDPGKSVTPYFFGGSVL